MKTSLRLLFALSLLASLPALSFCDNHDDDEEESELTENMEEMGDLYKELSKGLRSDASLDDVPTFLDRVAEFQELVLECKEERPELVEEIEDPTARNDAAKAYRIQMSRLLAASCELEITLLEGDLDAAAAAVKNMKSLKSKGHKEFIEDEDE